MLLNYHEIKEKPDLFRTMTSLDPKEFEQLLVPFEEAWNSYRKNPSRGRKPDLLPTIEDKLFFLLFYLKTYPLQKVLAYLFGMSQSQANEWIYKLSQVLQIALSKMGHMPTRVGKHLATTLATSQERCFVIDGTERRRQRPKENEKQKEYYSGKKKSHTVKNILVASLNTRKIRCLGGTHQGKKSDKKICDEEGYSFPEESELYQDKGFQGYEPEGVVVHQPKKKPRGGELCEEDKKRNTLISRIRIVIEHVIAGIKRCRIVKDVFRNTKEKYDDLVMEITCGLYNFRTDCRSAG